MISLCSEVNVLFSRLVLAEVPENELVNSGVGEVRSPMSPGSLPLIIFTGVSTVVNLYSASDGIIPESFYHAEMAKDVKCLYNNNQYVQMV